MKFNKIIREYLNDEITKKMKEAKDNNPELIEYNSRRDKAEAEIENILTACYKEITAVLVKYDMNLQKTDWRGTTETAKLIVPFYPNGIYDEKATSKINAYNAELKTRASEMARQIELDCALGADKEAFMQMVEKIKF